MIMIIMMMIMIITAIVIIIKNKFIFINTLFIGEYLCTLSCTDLIEILGGATGCSGESVSAARAIKVSVGY